MYGCPLPSKKNSGKVLVKNMETRFGLAEFISGVLVISSLLRRNEDNPPRRARIEGIKVRALNRWRHERRERGANSLPNRFEYPGHGSCVFERVNATFQRPPR